MRARREFDDIMAERDVVVGLNELERLIGEARGRREREKEKEKGDGGEMERERERERGVVEP